MLILQKTQKNTFDFFTELFGYRNNCPIFAPAIQNNCIRPEKWQSGRMRQS